MDTTPRPVTMNGRWLLFVLACLSLAAIAEPTDEMAHGPSASGVTIAAAEQTSPPSYDHGQSDAAVTCSIAGAVVAENVTTTVAAAAAATASVATKTVSTSLENTATTQEGQPELRERVAQLTNELTKAIAALTIAQHRVQRLGVLEREKYRYMRTVESRLLQLVDNVQNTKGKLTDDSSREQQIQRRLSPMNRTLDRTGRRLQVIRRLLAGAEVGLVHMESIMKLGACETDADAKKKSHQQQTSKP